MQCLTRTDFEAIFHKLLVFGGSVAFQYLVASVSGIVEEGVPDVFHVYANLMRSPRFEPALHKRNVSQPFEYLVVGHGMFCQWIFPFGKYGEEHPVARVAPQIADDGTFVFFHVSPHQCVVGSPCGFIEKLFSQVCFGIRSFGYQQQTRSILIDTVHKSHPRVVRIEIRIIFQVEGDGIEQRTFVIAHSGMHHQPRLLVDDEQFVIFIYNPDGYILRSNFKRYAWVCQHDGDDIQRLNPVV